MYEKFRKQRLEIKPIKLFGAIPKSRSSFKKRNPSFNKGRNCKFSAKGKLFKTTRVLSTVFTDK